MLSIVVHAGHFYSAVVGILQMKAILHVHWTHVPAALIIIALYIQNRPDLQSTIYESTFAITHVDDTFCV